MTRDPAFYLSVVIPAFNEESRLPATLQEILHYLGRQSYSSEVVVVDDGSKDRTADVVRQVPAGPVPVRLCRHADGANHGKGAALKLGMSHATGEYRLLTDADNSTSIDQVERFWPELERGFAVVIGSRKIAGAEVAVHQPLYKELAGRTGNLLIRMMAAPGILDTQAGFKIFTRRSAEELFPRLTIDRWGYDFELIAIARELGFKVREVPIRWVNSPDSKVRLNSYFEVLGEVWKVHRNLKSGRYRQPLP